MDEHEHVLLMQKHILGGTTNLLDSCFFGRGLDYTCFGLSVVFGGLAPMTVVIAPVSTKFKVRSVFHSKVVAHLLTGHYVPL